MPTASMPQPSGQTYDFSKPVVTLVIEEHLYIALMNDLHRMAEGHYPPMGDPVNVARHAMNLLDRRRKPDWRA